MAEARGLRGARVGGWLRGVANPVYLSPPGRCERLAEMAVRGGGTWTPRNGATRQDYALPECAEEEVRTFWRSGATMEWPQEGEAVLPGGRVFGSGVVLAADGASVARDVSVDFGKTEAEHWLMTFGKIRPPVTSAGTTAVAATTLGDGYAHWLLEELPRLLTVRLGECDAVIAHAANGLGREVLARRGWGGKMIVPRWNAHWACERLVVPSLVGPAGFPTEAVVRSVQEFAQEKGGVARPWGEKIYVSREKARRRRVTNDAELWARLEARGFVKVCAEEWSWAEQRAGFGAAQEIVAPHGAGLANLIFCRAGTRVVELFGRDYVQPGFWRLAAVAGLDYRPVVASGAEAITCELAANRKDFTVDVGAVERALG